MLVICYSSSIGHCTLLNLDACPFACYIASSFSSMVFESSRSFLFAHVVRNFMILSRAYGSMLLSDSSIKLTRLWFLKKGLLITGSISSSSCSLSTMSYELILFSEPSYEHRSFLILLTFFVSRCSQNFSSL